MSQIQSRQTDPERGDNIQNVTGDGHDPHEQPQSASNLPLPPQQGDSNFGDSSGPIFSMYSKIAKEEDDALVDRWQKDADGILIFTGLFSAAVAALLALSVPDLRPNSQDTSAFYLGNIYQILADPNNTISPTSITSPVARPPPFSPPRYAIWVNSLWFMSLVIGLTCALLATSLQQWARRYARVTQPARCSPEKRARMRAFFSRGVDNMNLPLVVEGLPALIHLAVSLFFAGLIIFLLNVNHSISIPVVSWIGFFSMLYAFITFMPMFRPDSPYHTPLSAPVSLISGFLLYFIAFIAFFLHCLAVVAAAIYALLRSGFIFVWIIIYSRTRPSEYPRLRAWYYSDARWKWFDRVGDRLYLLFSSIVGRIKYCVTLITNPGKRVEDITRYQSSEIDLGILDWTMSAVGEDDTLEKFFELIPGFFNSQMVNGIQKPLSGMFLSKFLNSWGGFMTRNLLSNSISEEIKIRRVVIAMNVIKEICHYTDMDKIFPHLSNLRFDQITPSNQAVEILSPWCTSSDTTISGLARYTVAKMLPYIQERDDRWIASTHDMYGLPEDILRSYISHGDDSVSLVILNHAVRHITQTEPRKWEMLASISKFDIRNTLPGLQNDFCALWNDMVRNANRSRYLVRILCGIRHLYIALHEGTDAAPTAFNASTLSDDTILDDLRSYPSCNVAAHRPDSAAFPSTLLEEPHFAFPGQFRSESQLYANDSTAVQQAADVNVTLRLPSSTDQAPPYSEESLLPPPTFASGLFSPRTNVVASPSIHDNAETIAPDLNPLVSTAPHLPPQPSLSTTDVVHAEQDVSPQTAVVLDADVAMSTGSLSARGNSDDMVRSIPMEASRHESEPVPSNPDIDENDPAPGGQLGD